MRRRRRNTAVRRGGGRARHGLAAGSVLVAVDHEAAERQVRRRHRIRTEAEIDDVVRVRHLAASPENRAQLVHQSAAGVEQRRVFGQRQEVLGEAQAVLEVVGEKADLGALLVQLAPFRVADGLQLADQVPASLVDLINNAEGVSLHLQRQRKFGLDIVRPLLTD